MEDAAGTALSQCLSPKELSSESKGYRFSEAPDAQGTARHSALAGSLLSTLRANAGMERTPK